MKSLSLDSPESTEHVQRRRHVGAAGTSEPHSNHSSSSRVQCTNLLRLYICVYDVLEFNYMQKYALHLKQHLQVSKL